MTDGPVTLLSLPSDLLICICRCVDSVATVAAAAQTCSAFSEACSSDAVWEPLCARRWATKARRYHLMPARRSELLAAGLSWREQFRRHEMDARRVEISAQELASLTFDFRFRFHGPTIGPASTTFRFGADGRVSGHPNGLTYEWRLLTTDRGQQRVQLGRFPPACVSRLSSWHWVVANPNVMLCSAAEDGHPHGTPPELLAELLDADRAPNPRGGTAVTMPGGGMFMLPMDEYEQLMRLMGMMQSGAAAAGDDDDDEDDDDEDEEDGEEDEDHVDEDDDDDAFEAQPTRPSVT